MASLTVPSLIKIRFHCCVGLIDVRAVLWWLCDDNCPFFWHLHVFVWPSLALLAAGADGLLATAPRC